MSAKPSHWIAVISSRISGWRVTDSMTLPKMIADADAGADGAETAADAERDRLAGVGAVVLGRRGLGEDW